MDTVKLDSNNFFLYKSEKIKPGLYIFRHNETQVLYIEPGDSLLIHINTMDFDESLAYSGKGGEKNNLLMYLFLTNETENLNLPSWFGLSSNDFEHKIDSLREIKLKYYKDFIDKNEVSDDFKDVALANIKYDLFSKKEMYAAANMSQQEKFDPHFFDYRKEIDFNQNELRFYYPYYRFLNRYFENLALSKMRVEHPIDRNSFEYNYKKIQLIDSLVSSDSIRNSLLRSSTIRYLLNAKDAENERQFFEAFKKMNTNKSYQKEVGKLADAAIKLTAGNEIPDILLVSPDNVAKNLKSILAAPTVLYFWSAQSAKHNKNIHNRVAELKSKYPEYDFIGINTDSHFRDWRKSVSKAGYNLKMEYQLENVADAEKKLVLNSLSKVIILDKNGIILDGKTNMFRANFEELLLGFLNR